MSLGFGQILILLVIVLILFGAGKLPKAAGDLAKTIKSFKKGLQDDGDSTETPPPKPPEPVSPAALTGPPPEAGREADGKGR
jgi:sec-independent protein translocase protein TatA